MNLEISQMISLGVWELVDPPPNVRLIQNKWIFKVKLQSDGTIERYKARSVLKGFTQKKGIDFHEVYAPVIRFEALRVILNVTLREDLVAYQADVASAFLNADLDIPLYMPEPDGFDSKTGKVLLLKKSIYGLKQSPKLFYEKMKSVLEELDLSESMADPCVFIGNPADKLIISLYVDDLIVVGKTEEVVVSFLERLKQRLQIKYPKLEYFLGLQIKRTATSLFIHQERYANELLEKFGMSERKPVATPLCRDIYSEDTSEEAQVPFREAVGSLQWLVKSTRPDLAFAVSFLSRHLERPTKKIWSLLQRTLRYLRGTSRYGIRYEKDGDENYYYFSDSDYASCPLSRRSVSGTMVVANQGPIFWSAVLQKSAVLSSCEAELFSATHAAQSIMYIHRLTSELGYNKLPTLLIDNQATIALLESNGFHKRSKHVSVRSFYIKSLIDSKQIQLAFVGSESNCADLCTKPSNKTTFQRLRSLVGVKEVPSDENSSLQN